MLIQYSISESWKWLTKSVMTSGTREIPFLFSLYFFNGKKGKCINRLAPDVRASLLITSLWLCYSRSRFVFVPHPSPQFTSPTLSPRQLFVPTLPPFVIQTEGKSTCRHGFMATLPVTLGPHATWRWAKRERKGIPQPRQKRQKSWRKHKHK